MKGTYLIRFLLYQTSGVRCLTFNPDGRTLLCGLHESLKVRAFGYCIMIGTIYIYIYADLDCYYFIGFFMGTD